MNTTLLIMAAGIGSRFGTGIKQLEPVDASNHIIMDYSIHDAIEAGFNHVVFIIRKDIEKEFKEVIGDRIAAICSAYCSCPLASFTASESLLRTFSPIHFWSDSFPDFHGLWLPSPSAHYFQHFQ